MGIVVRQSVKSAIITFAGAALGALVMLLSVAIFGKQHYGFQQNLQKNATLISYFCIFGYNYTVLIFGQRYHAGHPARGVFLRITLLIPTLIALITALLIFFFKEQLLMIFKPEDRPLLRQYYPLFPVFMIITVVMMWLEGYLQALNKSALQNFIREILLRLINIALVLLFASDFIEFSVFINLYVFLYVIPLAVLLYLARRSGGFRFEGSLSLMSPAERKEIYRFSAYHMLGVVSIVLVFQMDALLIPPFSKNGLEDVAVYSIAVFGVALMRNPARVIGIAATPSFTQTYNEGRIRDLSRLYSRSSVNMQIIALVMFLLIALNLDNGMRILAVIKPGYEQVKVLVLILMIGQIIEMGAGPNFELIGVTKYYKFNFWIALSLLGIIVVLNILLIKAVGLTGAAWATTIGLVLFNIAKAVFLWRKLKIQPLGKSTFVIIVIGLVIGLIVWLIPAMSSVYWDIALRTTITVLLLWIMLYKCNVSAELNELTRNILFKRRLF